jgi:hypothetical protein
MQIKSNNNKKGGCYVTNDHQKELQTAYFVGFPE